jgi:putative transposase
MKNTQWARLVAYVTGIVNQRLLLQNEYLIAENRSLRAHLPARIKLTNDQRTTLAEIGKRIGRKALQQIACLAKPDTILDWYRRLIARKFDGSKFREYPGRPSTFFRRFGIPPASKRSQNTTWADFIRAHMAVLAGIDFFTVEVRLGAGSQHNYVLFFIHLGTRSVARARITRHPTEEWMAQVARKDVDELTGSMRHMRVLLHDRDTKFSNWFRAILVSGGVQPLALPPRGPNLNAFAERG